MLSLSNIFVSLIRFLVIQAEDAATEDSNDAHDDDVPDGDTVDLAPYNLRKNISAFSDSWLVDNTWKRCSSSKGKGT